MRAVPRLASFTLAFALQLREKHGKTSVRVRVTGAVTGLGKRERRKDGGKGRKSKNKYQLV